MSVIDYSSRDFQSVISQIDSDSELKEQPSRFKIMIAGVFDVLNNTLNAVLNSLFIRTSFSRSAMQDLLNLIDYQMSWKKTSYADVTLTIDSAATISSSYTFLKSNLIFGTISTTSKEQVRFEALEDVIFPISTTVTTVRVYAKTTKDIANIGTSNGGSWQIFDLPDLDILKEYLTLTIGSDTYTLVDTFANSSNTDTHFRIYFRSDGSSYIKLGGIDSVSSTQYGKIPTNGTTIYANYSTGGGSNTIVEPATITEYLGNDSYFVSATNPAKSIGGQEEETIDNAKEIAPLLARTSGYFINESTGIALAKTIDGVLQATVIHEGLSQVGVYIVPVGGGLPSTTIKTNVQTLLSERSILGEITVNIYDPIYVPTSISINAKILSGYSINSVQNFIKLSIMVRLSEIAKSIIEDFNQNGLDSAISKINAYWYSIIGYNFNTLSDGSQISKILLNTKTNQFNRDLQPEDLIGAIEGFVEGIDYIKILTPSSTITAGNGGLVIPSNISVSAI